MKNKKYKIKKYPALLAAIMLISVGCAKAETQSPADSPTVDGIDYDDKTGIYMYLEDVTPFDGVLAVSQKSEDAVQKELKLDAALYIEKSSAAGEWEAVLSDKQADTGLAYAIQQNDEHFFYIDWSKLYGKLDPGHYRLKKSVYDFKNETEYDTYDFYTEFDVEEMSPLSEPPSLAVIDPLSSTENEYALKFCGGEWVCGTSSVGHGSMSPLGKAHDVPPLEITEYSAPASYMLKWGYKPDRLNIKEYASETDARPEAEISYNRHENNNSMDFAELKKNKTYVIQAWWDDPDTKGFGGFAYYAFTTQ